MSERQAAFAAPAVDSLPLPALAAMVALCVLWGLNQVAVKFVSADMPPFFTMGLRSLIAACCVWAWCAARGRKLFERDGTLFAGLAVGLLFGLEFAAIFLGLTYTTASRSAVLIYLAPFVVAVGAHLVLDERLTPLRVMGLMAAFAGVVLAFSDGLAAGRPDALIGDLLCVAAAILWGATTLVIKGSRLTEAPAEKTLLYQLAVSAALGLVLGLLVGEEMPDALSRDVLVVFLFQAVVVAFLSYLAYFALVARFPASLLSSTTFLTPLFGVALGGLLLGEAVTARLVAALALVAAGITLVNRPRRSGGARTGV